MGILYPVITLAPPLAPSFAPLQQLQAGVHLSLYGKEPGSFFKGQNEATFKIYTWNFNTAVFIISQLHLIWPASVLLNVTQTTLCLIACFLTILLTFSRSLIDW